MNDIGSEILKDNVLLVGRSPENAENWVFLDVQQRPEGGFGYFEQRPAESTLVGSGSGKFVAGTWGDFGSPEQALEALGGYLETHPIYENFEFGLGEINGAPNPEPSDIGAETTVRAKRGGDSGAEAIENGIRANTDVANNNRLENVQKNLTTDSAVPDNSDAATQSGPKTTGDSPTKMPPVLEGKTAAAAEGWAAGAFQVLHGLGDVAMSIFLLGVPPDQRYLYSDFEPAIEEFREFGDVAQYAAKEKDEFWGTVGGAGGYFVSELNPGSRAKALATAPKAIVTTAPKVAAALKAAATAAAKKAKDKAAKARKAAAATKALEQALKKNQNYKRLLKDTNLKQQLVKKSSGSWFQEWVSKKKYEYVGDLKKPFKKPDGTTMKTVQIDDLVIGENGKVVVIEAKFMGKKTEIPESGHVKFWQEKAEHLRRLVQFVKENPGTVSHLEITVSKEQAAEIYREILVLTPELTDDIGKLITFGIP